MNYVRNTFGIIPENFGQFDQNIEQFMTQLDLHVRFLSTKIAEGENNPELQGTFWQSNQAYDQMVFLIAHVLNEMQNGPVSTAYRRIAEVCDHTDTLITFNWDTLLDRAVNERGCWNPDTGYAVLFDNILDGVWRQPKAHKSDLTILKLHGSTNWLVNYMTRHLATGNRGMVTRALRDSYATISWDPNFDIKGGTLTSAPEVKRSPWGMTHPPDPSHPDAWPSCIANPSEPYCSSKDRYRPGYEPFSYFFPPNHPRTKVPMMPLIIAPTSFKLYEEFAHVIDPLWKYAQQALTKAEKVVIIGYSLPETDARSLRLLRRSFAEHRPVEVQVVDINPRPISDRLVSDVGLTPSIVVPLEASFSAYSQTIT